jgi:hypothetical protein
MRACDLDLDELEERIAQVRAQLDTSKRTLDELHIRIDADANAIKAQIQLDLDAFAKAFVAAVPSQIDAVDADDVKKFLPAFIEDKFKEWAEIEGAKLTAMLERLAEEVITITNENVAAASAALADRLGPEDTQVPISVDTFKYDIGVYALGAIGTAFLFINTLVGGLLTLAAPILAIVLRSKIAGDIRIQAKEKVPGAILHAAEAMKPHFDKSIDDFAKRLSDFVQNAGNTLYKGISEILDRTIAERRQKGSKIDEIRSETGDQIAAIAAARAALGQLRETLWKGDAEGEE